MEERLSCGETVTHLCSCLLAPHALYCSWGSPPASSTPVLSHPKYQSATVPQRGVALYLLSLPETYKRLPSPSDNPDSSSLYLYLIRRESVGPGTLD